MSWNNAYLHFKSNSQLDSLTANQMREKAYTEFVKQGLPTRKEEAWKYTSLNALQMVEWQSSSKEEADLTHEQMQEVSKMLPVEFTNYVFVNGFFNKTLSDDLSDSILLSEILSSDLEVSDTHVEAKILQLSNSFLSKKINIHIKKNKFLTKPVQLFFVNASKDSVYSSEKVNIQVEENAELTLLIHSYSFENSTADSLNLNINLNLASFAKVKFAQLQNEDTSSFHFSQVQCNLNSGAQLLSLAISLGTKLTRNYLHTTFVGENAYAGVYGLSVLDSQQHVDNYTFIQHQTGLNQSVQHYKSILSGAAHSVFRGRVRIEPNAQKANSAQLNNNLLLTREAQADSIPQLEIFADDVKAGHGSTVGQLNKDEIFYFLSRGIGQMQAVKMLSTGYVKDLVYKFENIDMQNYLFKAIEKKLDRMMTNV